MTVALKAFLKRHWPALRLRTLLLAVLLFAAAMPGVGAISLRVYENSLVRQTEAELMAQGAALAAVAQTVWPGAPPPAPAAAPERSAPLQARARHRRPEQHYRARAPPALPAGQPDPAAIAVARRLAPVFDRTSAPPLPPSC
jgi:hypothetical protein